MKPRISYADLAWSAAFASIEKGQTVLLNGLQYRVEWKHTDPEWLELRHRAGRQILHILMVRKGDPLLLELRHE